MPRAPAPATSARARIVARAASLTANGGTVSFGDTGGHAPELQVDDPVEGVRAERQVGNQAHPAEKGRFEVLGHLGSQRVAEACRVRRGQGIGEQAVDQRSAVPTFEVMMMTVLRKSMSRPSPSFIVPLSNT